MFFFGVGFLCLRRPGGAPGPVFLACFVLLCALFVLFGGVRCGPFLSSSGVAFVGSFSFLVFLLWRAPVLLCVFSSAARGPRAVFGFFRSVFSLWCCPFVRFFCLFVGLLLWAVFCILLFGCLFCAGVVYVCFPFFFCRSLCRVRSLSCWLFRPVRFSRGGSSCSAWRSFFCCCVWFACLVWLLFLVFRCGALLLFWRAGRLPAGRCGRGGCPSACGPLVFCSVSAGPSVCVPGRVGRCRSFSPVVLVSARRLSCGGVAFFFLGGLRSGVLVFSLSGCGVGCGFAGVSSGCGSFPLVLRGAVGRWLVVRPCRGRRRSAAGASLLVSVRHVS